MVIMYDEWQGSMHAGHCAPFDSIGWRAEVTNGIILRYVVGARRGDQSWIIEAGDLTTIERPPILNRDPQSSSIYKGFK